MIFFSVVLAVNVGTFVIKLCGFNFSSDINLIDYLNLIVTSLLGIYIAFVLQKKQTINRVEQDLIIEEIKGIKLVVRSLHFEGDKIHFNDTVKAFKSLGISSQELKGLLNEVGHNDLINVVDSIDIQLRTLKRDVTGSKVRNGFLILKSEHATSYILRQRTLLKLLSRLIIKINRR